MKKSYVLLGGGLDSAAAALVAIEESDVVSGIFFKYNPVMTPTETAVQQITAELKIDLKVIEILNQPQGYAECIQQLSRYVPDRNLLYLVTASVWAKMHGVEQLYTGFCKGAANIYDITPDFVAHLNMLWCLDKEFPMELKAPFVEQTKTDIVKFLKFSHFPIEITYSCHMDTPEPCGECGACLGRQKALQEAGLGG